MSSLSEAVPRPGSAPWPLVVNRVGRIALPILLSSLVSLFAPLVNAAIVGRHHPADLYVLALLLPVIFLQTSVNDSLRVSSVAFSSQAAGSGDLATLNRRLQGVAAAGVALNACIALVFLVGHDLFMRVYDVPPARQGVAFLFIQLSILTGTLLMVSITTMSSLYGLGRVRQVTIATVAGLTANVTITFVLVTWSGLGLFSIPVSTTITASVTIAWAGSRLAALGILRRLPGSPLRPLRSSWREIARISAPVCGSYLLLFVNSLLFTRVLALFGPADVAGFGIAYRVQTVVLMPGIAIGIGLAINVNRMVAARESGQVRTFMSTALLGSFAVFVLLGAAIFGARGVLAGWMTGDGTIASAAAEYLANIAPAYALFGPLLTLIVFLEETGNGFRALVFNVGLIAMQLVLAFSLAETGHSLHVVYRALAMSYLAAAPFVVYELARSRRLGGHVSRIQPS